MRVFVGITTAFLLLALVTAPPAIAQTEDELIARFLELAEAGQDVTAMDLLCRIDKHGVECGKADPYAEYYRAARELWHRRYREVFQPPGNADALTYSTWDKTTPWSGYNRDGVLHTGAEIDGIPTSLYVPWDMSVDDVNRIAEASKRAPYMSVTRSRPPRTLVDLDLDGQPEVVFRSHLPEVASGMEVLTDDAQDGRRIQWLIGPAGSNPRDAASIWIYRDGCFRSIFVDTDGDGRGNCAVSDRLRDSM